MPFYYCNSVGAQNNGKNIVAFDGGTTAYNQQGEPVITSDQAFAPDELHFEHGKLPQAAITRQETPAIAQKYQAIQQGLHYIKDMLGWENHPKFVVGVSGGIDSALVVCLLQQAFGSDSVWSVNMPTKYNSNATQNAAQHIANKLNITHRQIPIQTLADQQLNLFADLDNSAFPAKAPKPDATCPTKTFRRKFAAHRSYRTWPDATGASSPTTATNWKPRWATPPCTATLAA